MESEDSTSEVQAQLTLAVKRRKLEAEANKLIAAFSSPLSDGQSQSNMTSSNNIKGNNSILDFCQYNYFETLNNNNNNNNITIIITIIIIIIIMNIYCL